MTMLREKVDALRALIRHKRAIHADGVSLDVDTLEQLLDAARIDHLRATSGYAQIGGALLAERPRRNQAEEEWDRLWQRADEARKEVQ